MSLLRAAALLAIAASLTAGVALAETLEYRILKEGVLEERLRRVSPKVAERYERLRALFTETNCPDLREQQFRGSKEPNLICAVDRPMETGNAEPRRLIIVGAHYDSAGGDGVIDNWTGAILLPSLAEFIAGKPRRHEYQFLGFAAEERGLLGSAAYLKSIPKEQRGRIAAVVTIDSLGLSPTKFWPNSSNEELALLADRIAQALQLGFAGVNVDAVGTTDSMTFHRAKIPVLSLHSVTQETWKLINSPKDVWSSLSWKDYYDSHRFISAFIAYLDQKLP